MEKPSKEKIEKLLKEIEGEDRERYLSKQGIKDLYKIMFDKEIDFSNLRSEIKRILDHVKTIIQKHEEKFEYEKRRAYSYMAQAKRLGNLVRFKHPEIRETYVHNIEKDFNPLEYKIIGLKDDVFVILKKGDDTKILHEHFYEELVAIYRRIENERKIIEKVPVKNNKQKIFSEIRNKLINTKSQRKNNILAIAEVVYDFEGELDTGEIHSKVIDKIKSRTIVLECLDWLHDERHIGKKDRKKPFPTLWWWIARGETE